MAAQAPAGLPFPLDPAEFDSDDRISFSKLDNKFIAVHDDGSEFEFDRELKRWIPSLDEELVAQQQAAYGGASEDADDDSAQHANKKRKHANGEAGRGNKRNKQQHAQQTRQNTAVYVTGLPLDATVDEVHEVFSRKCGVIAEEIDSGKPRIKLYNDDAGHFKGDALVVFFKPQSVEMAIMLLDDTDFRFSASGTADGRMRVQAADASYKKTHYDKEGGEAGGEDGREAGQGSHDRSAGAGNGDKKQQGGGSGGGEGSGSKARDNKGREQDKQKVIKRTQKLDAKLADWDDDDVDGPYTASQLEIPARRDKMVILRHMFTLQELADDPAALLDIKEDVRDECSKLGVVTNVVLYDLEEDGVVSVKFRTVEAAQACVETMDGRAFDGRTVRAGFPDGKEKFRKSGRKQDEDLAEEGEEAED